MTSQMSRSGGEVERWRGVFSGFLSFFFFFGGGEVLDGVTSRLGSKSESSKKILDVFQPLWSSAFFFFILHRLPLGSDAFLLLLRVSGPTARLGRRASHWASSRARCAASTSCSPAEGKEKMASERRGREVL